eukprot:COSAG06_NODE_27778_length_586_cov_4.833676_1_plen_67_part_10
MCKREVMREWHQRAHISSLKLLRLLGHGRSGGSQWKRRVHTHCVVTESFDLLCELSLLALGSQVLLV